MNTTDQLIERFVRLAHGINTHNPDFIDAYFGNPEWTQPHTTDLNALETETLELLDLANSLDPLERRRSLEAQLRAALTSIRLQRGDEVSYHDEVTGLYDILPERASQERIDQAIASMDSSLPGTGSVFERWEQAQSRFEVPAEHLPRLVEVLDHELQQRSRKLFKLPQGEHCDYQYDADIPFYANQYQGGGHSISIVSTGEPTTVTRLPVVIAHECYPGHHTEQVLKEKYVSQNGWHEFGLHLLHSPQSVVAEGIATTAIETIMDDEEIVNLTQRLAALAKLDLSLDEIRAQLLADRGHRELNHVASNASLMLHQEHRPKAEVLEYLMTYRGGTLHEAERGVEMLNSIMKSYIFTYTAGKDLVEELWQNGDRIRWFERLLTEPVTPSQLRAWNENPQRSATTS
jgi:hypothetical protein